MITLAILAALLLTAVLSISAITVVFGAGLIAVFGDLIVCVVLITLLVKLFRRKRK